MGFWLGLMQGVSEAEDQKRLEQIQARQQQKATLLKQFESVMNSPNLHPDATGELQQRIIELAQIDPTKSPSGKKLEQLASLPMTFWSSTQVTAPQAAQPEIPDMPGFVSASAINQLPVSMRVPGMEMQDAYMSTPPLQEAQPYRPPQIQQVSPRERSWFLTDEERNRRGLIQAIEQLPLAVEQARQMEEAKETGRWAAEVPARATLMEFESQFAAPPKPPSLTEGQQLRHDVAMNKFGKPMDQLTPAQVMEVRQEIARFEQQDRKMTTEEELAQIYTNQYVREGLNPEEARRKGLESARIQRSQSMYDVRNPSVDETQIDRLIEMATTGRFDEAMKMIGSNVRARNQFLKAMLDSGRDPFALTSNTRTMGETAKSLIPKMDDTLQKIKSGKYDRVLGVAATRWNEFMAGAIGAGDPEFAELRSTLSLINTGVMRAHVGARGSAMMLDYFGNLVDRGRMDKRTLVSSLQAVRDFINGYKELVFPDALFSHPPTDIDGAGARVPDLDPDELDLRNEYGF